ncbi:MAG: VOC family protein [Methanospirillum sp.]|uniref:VOC family protein n=1 Tax=Methanospirillum sp. TaxID=45200 RepID=UPI00236BF4E6|nr:VOC family protein [Methanospirillum sp.]MDD1728361.1 VOC family protein [Methanospirillum sp.]
MNRYPHFFRLVFFLSLLFMALIPVEAGIIDQSSTSRNQDWKIDHAVVVVSDLNRSIEEFKDAGYTVIPGGEFPGAQTHNALIPFVDGSYIELFAPVDPALSMQMNQLVTTGIFDEAMNKSDPMEKRFMLHLAEGPGVRDFALASPDLNLTLEPSLVAASGLNLSYPIAMTRNRPDGETVAWYVDVPLSQTPMALPFLIADETPRSYRAPEVNASYHANGATGIRSITVAVTDPAETLPLYDAMLPGVSRNQDEKGTIYTLNGSSVSIIRNADTTKHDGPVNIELKKGEDETLSLRGLSL